MPFGKVCPRAKVGDEALHHLQPVGHSTPAGAPGREDWGDQYRGNPTSSHPQGDERYPGGGVRSPSHFTRGQ